MFDNITLNELDDSQLQDVLDAAGKGKPAIYRKPIRELLAVANGSQGTVAVPWKVINPDADKRQTVVSGMTAAIKRDDNAKDRMTIRANTDENLVTVIIRKAA